jgi:hypothetical protein
MLNRPFGYQSCTNAAYYPGSFSGHMTFVPGTLDNPTGAPFDVTIGEFPLTVPDFIF